MTPDLHSMPLTNHPNATSPPSRPTRISIGDSSNNPYQTSTPSPRSPTQTSLQAAAAINASMRCHSPSSTSPHAPISYERRRSSFLANLSLNDPNIPGPGEMAKTSASTNGSPSFERKHHHSPDNPTVGPHHHHSPDNPTVGPHHHHHQPNLGDLHQELENEQEAQVNRLLALIRSQQQEIANLQAEKQQQRHSNASTTPPSSESPKIAHTPAYSTPTYSAPTHSHVRRLSYSPGSSGVSSTSLPLADGMARQNQTPQGEDEFQKLKRENDNLKARLGELERLILGGDGVTQTGVIGVASGVEVDGTGVGKVGVAS